MPLRLTQKIDEFSFHFVILGKNAIVLKNWEFQKKMVRGETFLYLLLAFFPLCSSISVGIFIKFVVHRFKEIFLHCCVILVITRWEAADFATALVSWIWTMVFSLPLTRKKLPTFFYCMRLNFSNVSIVFLYENKTQQQQLSFKSASI